VLSEIFEKLIALVEDGYDKKAVVGVQAFSDLERETQ
jgi:hypothetical protein